MVERILVPLDGSERSERAIPYAVGIALGFGAQVILLRVVESTAKQGSGWLGTQEWRLGRLEAFAYLDRVKRRLTAQGICVDVDVGLGPPAEEILEMARDRRADLIVLTSHGRGGPSPFPLASTAHKVVSGTDISVLMVPSGEDRPDSTRTPFDRILVPLDGSGASEWALRFAAHLHRIHGGELRIVQVVPDPESYCLCGDLRAQQLSQQLARSSREHAKRYLSETSAQLDGQDLTIESEVLTGANVARRLEDAARQAPGAIIVLSSRGASTPSGSRLGTVPAALLSRAQTPVLVLRDGVMFRARARPHHVFGTKSRWRSSDATVPPANGTSGIHA